ncbi:MAG TPA: hypothetical protein VIC53_08380 [Wenzhouxiangella sp.]
MSDDQKTDPEKSETHPKEQSWVDAIRAALEGVQLTPEELAIFDNLRDNHPAEVDLFTDEWFSRRENND